VLWPKSWPYPTVGPCASNVPRLGTEEICSREGTGGNTRAQREDLEERNEFESVCYGNITQIERLMGKLRVRYVRSIFISFF
jgi:hypothetical protein